MFAPVSPHCSAREESHSGTAKSRGASWSPVDGGAGLVNSETAEGYIGMIHPAEVLPQGRAELLS